jgi:hypothetical protein
MTQISNKHDNSRVADCPSASWSASLAEKITVALLTPWRGEKCHRLQIMLKTGPGFHDEKNMGGRNEDSIFETVLEIIEDFSRQNAESRHAEKDARI